VLLLQGRPQLTEDGRQVPAAEDVGVIERCRPALQRRQVVLRIKDLFVLRVRAGMRGNHLAAEHHVDAPDVGFDRHSLKGGTARHAIAVVVEADHLVLVGLGRLDQARVEGVGRE
jgi:hypothetical protein